MRQRELLVSAFRAAVDAVAAGPATAAAVPDLELGGASVCVLALGKAAVGMAWGFCEAHAGPVDGLVVAAEPAPVPPGMDVMVGDHPVPSRRSLAAGEALLRTAQNPDEHDAVVVLVSGGGSALAEALLPGIEFEDLQDLTGALLRSGAPIEDINAVRIALSRLKGGGLAAAAGATRVVTLAISDVPDDAPEIIASGPTVASLRREQAQEVLRRLGSAVPPAIRRALDATAEAPRASGERYVIVASRRDAAAAAATHLRHAGTAVDVVDAPLRGEAADRARRIVAEAPRTGAVVYSGETTVTVRGGGAGGRNQEAALAAAIALAGRSDTAFLAAGTDGIDGTTNAAGAVVDGSTVTRARTQGRDPSAFLAAHDSGGFFAGLPEQIVTGRTGTNIGDIWIVLGD